MNPKTATPRTQSKIIDLNAYRQRKQRFARLQAHAARVLERLNQSEELYLGAKAIELLVNG